MLPVKHCGKGTGQGEERHMPSKVGGTWMVLPVNHTWDGDVGQNGCGHGKGGRRGTRNPQTKVHSCALGSWDSWDSGLVGSFAPASLQSPHTAPGTPQAMD